MEAIVVPHGQAGWRERMRLFEEIVSRSSGRCDGVLVLTAAARLRRIYGRSFLDLARRLLGANAVVPPAVLTLHQFVQQCHTRLGGGALIDENTRLILFEGIVKEIAADRRIFTDLPDLFAPALAAAAADMAQELALAGVGPGRLASALSASDAVDRPQSLLLSEAYARYEASLEAKGLTDPAAMLASVAARFDPAWLDRYDTIIIDGIHEAAGPAAQLIAKIAALGRGLFLVDGPSAELVRSAGEHHPLRPLRVLLHGLGVIPADAPSPANEDDRYLASALFSDRSFAEVAASRPASFGKSLRLIRPVSTREEVTFIADEVKRSLLDGTPPDEVLVAFPSLDAYGALVEEVFRDHDIPYNRALGRPLSTSPVATAAVSLLDVCREDFAGPTLLRALGSPFLLPGADRRVATALDRFLRERRITGGRERILGTLRRHAPEDGGEDVLTAPLTGLLNALGPFMTAGQEPLTTWMDRLSSLLAWSGIKARVDTIPGDFNSNLMAFRKFEETLASLRQAGSLFPELRFTFNEWLLLFTKALHRARYQVPADDEAGVQVLGLEEAMNRPWQEVYLGGLADGKFPQRLPQNIFLPEALLEQLGVRTLETARQRAAYHFYRLLLSAPKATLSCPAAEGDKPIVPSPFLEELTPLITAGLLETREQVQFGLTIEQSMSLPQLAKALAMGGPADLGPALQAAIPGMAAVRSALAPRTAPAGGFPTAAERTEFSVTEIDDYLSCPYGYFVRHRLRLAPLEEVTEDITAAERGSRTHRVLRRFYDEWREPVSGSNRGDALALLVRLADAEFGEAADTFRNRRERNLFLNTMAVRFLDSEIAVWQQGLRPAYLEQSADPYPLSLSDGTAARLRGTIDRIDTDGSGNFVVVDYKTGKYPQPKMGVEQEIFQLPVYALMAQASRSLDRPVLARPLGLAYYDLRGVTRGGARDVVLFDKDLRSDHPNSKPKASPKTSDEFAEILQRALEKARAAVEGIRSGRYPAEPAVKTACRSCPGKPLCGGTSQDDDEGGDEA